MPTFVISTQHFTGDSSSLGKKINKRQPDWKEEVNWSQVIDDKILYLGNLKESTKNLLELIDTFSEVVSYKINYISIH